MRNIMVLLVFTFSIVLLAKENSMKIDDSYLEKISLESGLEISEIKELVDDLELFDNEKKEFSKDILDLFE